MIIPPHQLLKSIAMAIRAHACGPTGFALAACTHWMTDGTAAAICAAKRRDAAARQRILRKAFAGLTLTSDPHAHHAYHAWLTLPAEWRADVFEAAAARNGIAVVPAAAFAVMAGHAPNAVRLALASPTLDTLTSALTTLATLARDPRDRQS
jgi:DNA-binding transcriptional MocR family regulator